MIRRRLFLTTAFGLCSSLIAGSSAGLLRAAPKNELVIVVAETSRLHDLPLRDLKRMYLGEHVSGPNGERLIPLNHPRNAAERTDFEMKVLGMDPDEVGRYWIDRKIRGQSGPPKAVTPSERLHAAIKRVKGTLTYLKASDVEPGMKVLEIDGKSPGDSGYPLTY